MPFKNTYTTEFAKNKFKERKETEKVSELSCCLDRRNKIIEKRSTKIWGFGNIRIVLVLSFLMEL